MTIIDNGTPDQPVTSLVERINELERQLGQEQAARTLANDRASAAEHDARWYKENICRIVREFAVEYGYDFCDGGLQEFCRAAKVDFIRGSRWIDVTATTRLLVPDDQTVESVRNVMENALRDAFQDTNASDYDDRDVEISDVDD